MSASVTVKSGVNTLSLNLAGESLATVAHKSKSLLNLSGDEKLEVNGATKPGDYILQAGDTVEFVKAAGRKGSGNVTVKSGVNTLSLNLADSSLATVAHKAKSLLNLSGDEKIEVNGSTKPGDYILQAGDTVEFVKAAGRKGSGNVTVKSGVNTLSLNLAGESLATVGHKAKSLLNLSGDEKLEVNGGTKPGTYILQAGDTVEFVKAAGRKGADTVAVKYGVNTLNLTVGGKTVGDVRTQAKSLLNLDDDASAEVDGEEVDEDFVLPVGSTLEFIKSAGTKGC